METGRVGRRHCRSGRVTGRVALGLAASVTDRPVRTAHNNVIEIKKIIIIIIII